MPLTPYSDAVADYHRAGWPAILPVPPATKTPPPVGYTGAEGADTPPEKLAEWAVTHAGSSIALRMPDGVIGIDVDCYAKGGVTKHGEQTLAAAEQRWGPLPPTWTSTARRGDQPSRIHFYRAPARRYATVLEGGDVEIIQRHHRYAVVRPSWHADADARYEWYGPSGALLDEDLTPRPDELPWLPEAWVAGLAAGAAGASAPMAGYEAGEAMLTALRLGSPTPCAEVANALMTAAAELVKADAGSRHDTMTGRVHQLVQLGAAGHPGAAMAWTKLRELWAELTAGEGRETEFDRMLLTSARKAATVYGPAPVGNDPCLFTGGMEVARPAPGDDRVHVKGEEPLVETPPPVVWNLRTQIGAELFDPAAGTDQTLAEAVLARTYPVLRFAHDAKAWLLRGPEFWDARDDLAEWAVAALAPLMPRGDASAEKGSEDFDRAARRKRFMSSAGSSGMAKKMRALVAGGDHPCSVELGKLDLDPDVIWAGGQAWDIRASLGGLVPADIDPATPHLHSAAVGPRPGPTPLWNAFTAAVWPDPAIRAWALRVLSVAFTGHADKALPILIGDQNVGKTQVIVLLMDVLGSYAHAADPRLLSGVDNAHASIIYALKGRRLSFIDEGPREGRLGQERLKQLTGSGDLTGNQMQRNPITFTPTHTLVLTANDEPLLTDPAVRGRTRLIPCAGDVAAVRAARAAIGHTASGPWRAEASAVLAAMIGEAAAWLADPASAFTAAAPESIRGMAEAIAEDQDPIRGWVEDACEVDETGTRSRELYEAFVGWCRNGNHHPSRIPSETRWGGRLAQLGFKADKRRDGNYRTLRLNFGSQDHLWRVGGGLVEGWSVSDSASTPSTTPVNVGTTSSPVEGVEGVEGYSNPTHIRTHALAHTRAHAPAHTQGLTLEKPSTPSATFHSPANTGGLADTNPPQTLHQPSTTADTRPFSRQLSDKLQSATAGAKLRGAESRTTPSKPASVATADRMAARADLAAEKAAVKLTAKAAEKRAKLDAAAGEAVTLPAAVTRDGAIRPVALAEVITLLDALGAFAELIVDVEHTGYPIGHADHALRTVQLGTEHAAVVLDASDPEQLAVAARCLARAQRLVAHSVTADLVPLWAAGALPDIEGAWGRVHDTAITALLADPQSTGSDAGGLKDLAQAVLGEAATAPAADEARGALFKAGGWLKDIEAGTPVTRSGWAQAPYRATMVRYAASDVLDTGALARRLPQPPSAVLERERIAQRATARVAHRGLRLDPGTVAEVRARMQADQAAAAEQVRAFGIDNPGSSPQVGAKLAALGAQLPRTGTGRLSVAKGAIEALRNAQGPVGECVRAVLAYRKPSTALSLLLDPYHELVTRGDGRARPTVYTLGADTGRMSCVRPNLQQVSRQGGIRACITADPGQLIVSADFASVEIRVAAALSGDVELQRMIAEGVDLHGLIARQVYGPDATKEDRYNVKRGVFGKLYGSGIPGIARTLAISQHEAAAMVGTLDSLTPGLARFTADLKRAVSGGMAQFETYSGRVVHLDTKLPHKALNYCVQGTARELLVDTLVKLQDTRFGTATLLPVHDEVLITVGEDDAEEATATLVACMEAELNGVRIKAEASAPSFAWQDAS